MNDRAYDEGKQAAAKDIAADANPYQADTTDHAQWAEGHASVASAVEASQSEGI